jgi:hypothetical protein
MARALRVPTVAGVLGWGVALLGFVVGCRPLTDNSLFTHIATGRLITHGGIPRLDPYSFTARGEPWVVQSWLVSTLYGFTERIAGLDGIRVIGGLLVAALLGLTWHLTAGARSLVPRVALTGVAIAVNYPFRSPRPLLLGLVLLALVLIVLVEGHDPRVLVPVMWMWVNANGSFALGVVAVACVCAGRFLDGDRQRRVWRPLGWAAAGAVAGAVSPLGPRLLVFPVQLLGRMEVLSRVVEWRSPDFGELFARAFLVQLALAVVLLVRRPSYETAVPLAVFTAIALAGQRSVPHASLVMMPGLALGLTGVGRLDGRERRAAVLAAGGVLTAMALLSARAALAEPPVDLRTYPTDGLAWLEGHRLLGGGARVATEDTTGNLLELLRGDGASVFFDDRYDMFPLAVSRDYLDLFDATPRWDDVATRWRIDYLLWPRSSALSSLVASSPRWRVLYQDPTSLVACRRASNATEC